MYSKEALKSLINEKSLKRGDFTLASGKKSTYYLDGKQVSLSAEGARLIGEGMFELLKADARFPDAVGGMSIGADPITAAVITIAALNGHKDLKGFLVRKESKGHGTNQYVEGPLTSGDHVVVVEDVVTTGGSSLKAIERLEAVGMIVDGVLAIIDRKEGGRKAFEEKGYSFSSLLTIEDFGITPPEA